MRTARPILLAPLLALAACMDVTGSGHPLVISGTVTVAGTAQPVPNAAVEVYSTPLIAGERYLMETGMTDALGRFSVRIEEQRNYAQPNCAAMALWVRAAGYLDGGAVEIGTHEDPSCESGSATVSVALTPVP